MFGDIIFDFCLDEQGIGGKLQASEKARSHQTDKLLVLYFGIWVCVLVAKNSTLCLFVGFFFGWTNLLHS